jgi:hypothetical protein
MRSCGCSFGGPRIALLSVEDRRRVAVDGASVCDPPTPRDDAGAMDRHATTVCLVGERGLEAEALPNLKMLFSILRAGPHSLTQVAIVAMNSSLAKARAAVQSMRWTWTPLC